jgi:hypothetical protein
VAKCRVLRQRALIMVLTPLVYHSAPCCVSLRRAMRAAVLLIPTQSKAGRRVAYLYAEQSEPQVLSVWIPSAGGSLRR